MGTVYLATDSKLERTVALKVLVKTDATPANLIRRFHAEALTAARLRHPHIVTVYDSGEVEGFLYLALEYIKGPDVEKVIRKQGAIPVKRSLSIVRQIAQALDHAHGAGVVHRDIKPSNILMRKDGSVTLTDMGLARAMGETSASNITRAGYTVGTVDYMAPEQARSSRAADARSDLYSLGCTWFHMLTGRVPYPEGDLTNKLRAHANGPPPDPRVLNPAVPAGVVAVIRRLMAQRPEDRYQSPHELLEDLDQPNLCRVSVSEDDLRMLAEEFDEESAPAAIDLHEDSADGSIPAGSTMVEATDFAPASQKRPMSRPKKKPRPAAARPNWKEVPRPKKKRPRPPAPDDESPPGQSARESGSNRPNDPQADKIRAAIVLAVLLVLLAGVVWMFANLDSWIGAGPASTATPSRQVEGRRLTVNSPMVRPDHLSQLLGAQNETHEDGALRPRGGSARNDPLFFRLNDLRSVPVAQMRRSRALRMI